MSLLEVVKWCQTNLAEDDWQSSFLWEITGLNFNYHARMMIVNPSGSSAEYVFGFLKKEDYVLFGLTWGHHALNS